MQGRFSRLAHLAAPLHFERGHDPLSDFFIVAILPAGISINVNLRKIVSKVILIFFVDGRGLGQRCKPAVVQ